jgi:hypothetical protein
VAISSIKTSVERRIVKVRAAGGQSQTGTVDRGIQHGCQQRFLFPRAEIAARKAYRVKKVCCGGCSSPSAMSANARQEGQTKKNDFGRNLPMGLTPLCCTADSVVREGEAGIVAIT